MYTIWYSTESFADYIIDHSDLHNKNTRKCKIYESDANKPKEFHTIPDHIKKILYLDAPDLIIEYNNEPICSIEISREAGTGHNSFQRFSRLSAAVENNVPAFYIYPEAAIISRQNNPDRWDSINALIFKALDHMMTIYNIPAFLYYYPSHFHTTPNLTNHNLTNKGLIDHSNIAYTGCPAMQDDMLIFIEHLNLLINKIESCGVLAGRQRLLTIRDFQNKKQDMSNQYNNKRNNRQPEDMSPLSSTIKIPTVALLRYLSNYENHNYNIGSLLRSRQETIVYKVAAQFRGDPYPGALAAIDYLLCRTGKTFEDREYNLILVWGEFNYDQTTQNISITSNKKDQSINNFIQQVKKSESKNLLSKTEFNQLKNHEIPRYYMQTRYGSTYSKSKEIRVYSYFSDAILFHDGALWRDG